MQPSGLLESPSYLFVAIPALQSRLEADRSYSRTPATQLVTNTAQTLHPEFFDAKSCLKTTPTTYKSSATCDSPRSSRGMALDSFLSA